MEQHLEALQEAERYLENVKNAIYGMMKKLSAGETDTIFHTLSLLSEGLDWLLTVFKMTESIQIEKIDTSELPETVSTLVEGMENKDWNLLEDCLEYSLLDQVIEWQRVIRVILDQYNVAPLEN